MIYRFKFRVRGSQFPGKFVFTLEEGKEIFLDMTFQPSPVHTEETCLFLEVHEGKAFLHFIGKGIKWNGKPAPKGPVELHPGHLIQLDSQSVEILECPEGAGARERTVFLDLSSLGPRESTHVPIAMPAPSQPAPGNGVSIRPGISPAFQPMPEGSLNSPDSVAQPEPGDTFDPDALSTPAIGGAAHALPASAAIFDLNRKVSNTTALGVIFFALGLAALAFPNSYLTGYFHRRTVPSGDIQAVVAPSPIPVSQRESSTVPAVRVVAIPLPPEPRPGTAPNHEVSSFLEALKKNDLLYVQQAIEKKNLSQDFTFDDQGRSPLARAASFGHAGLVKYLHSRNADVNALDFAGNSALMWAIANTQEETVKLLLALGADPLTKRKDGLDAAVLAQQSGNPRIQQAVIGAVQSRSNKAHERSPASEAAAASRRK